MREQLPAGDVLQKHVEVSTVLGQSFEVDLGLMDVTMKGWEMELRILYSLEMWSTCCDLMSSSLRMTFTQLNLPVALRLTNRTLPKEPESKGTYLHPALSDNRSPLSTPTASLVFRLSSTLLYSKHRTNTLTSTPPTLTDKLCPKGMDRWAVKWDLFGLLGDGGEEWRDGAK
jgi:hypothetical protein